jgi:hypothetical protein
MDDNRVTYFAETDARNKRVKFGIKSSDRTRHVYVIGKTGMGKSCLLENMAVQDIQSGAGLAFIDPHGKTAELLLEYIPKERIRDVIYIAPFDTDYPISFNVLESIDETKRHLVVSGLMSTFKKIWEDAWSARMEYILTNTLLALLEAPGTTLLGVNRMLSDKEYRREIVSQIKDPSVKAFWTKEFANYTERQAAEAVPAIQNKVGQFTANPLIRNMIGQPVSSFDFRKAMDERKIIIINLSKGKVGDENMKLLGGLLVTKIYLAAMSRADMPDRVVKTLPNFYLFVDEFQNFANASFADILSEARKYKLNLTIAHQYVEQMDENVSAAVFGNVGTMIAFRVGATDAEVLEKEFGPTFMLEDLVNLGFAQIYLKLMIDGLTSSPFSATTLPPIAQPAVHYVDDIIAASREQYARPRAEVEEVIIKFHEPTPKAPVAPKVTVTAVPKITVAPKASVSPAAVSAASSVSILSASPKETVKKVDTFANQARQTSSPTTPVAVKPLAVHQPFKAAFQAVPIVAPKSIPVVKPITIVEPTPPMPIAKPVPSDAPKPHSSLIQPAPLPLSSLNKNIIAPKMDPKIPTADNVNQLKSALMAALAKSKEKREEKPPVVKSVIPPAVPQAPVKEAPVKETSPAREVPEDVLKKVLKID